MPAATGYAVKLVLPLLVRKLVEPDNDSAEPPAIASAVPPVIVLLSPPRIAEPSLVSWLPIPPAIDMNESPNAVQPGAIERLPAPARFEQPPRMLASSSVAVL